MKKIINLLSLFMLIGLLQSCGNKSKKTTEVELENPTIIEKPTETKPVQSEFESLLKQNKKLKLGTVYTDTVNYVNFDDNGDYLLFFVEKNQDTIGLIHNKHKANFIKDETIEIQWKMDSLRPAGDPEFLDFKEFIISTKRIEKLQLNNKKDTTFKEELLKLKLKNFPLIDSTSFDSFINQNDYKIINAQVLQLNKFYKNWGEPKHNYRAIDAYRLNLSNDFYTVVVTVLQGDNELENRLINYNLNGSVIASEIVAYDKLAEGWTRFQSKIEAKKITIHHVLVSEDDATQMETNTLKIEDNGTLKQLTIDDVFYALVIKKLNINNTKLIPSLNAFKILPNSPNEAIVLIPEIEEGSEEDHFFYLNTHIAIVNLETKQVTQQYFESSKTNGWVSDAIVLTDINIDTAPYYVTDKISAFGIRTHFVGSSRVSPYESETLSLFVKSGDALQNVLHNFKTIQNIGQWDGNCVGEFQSENKILFLSEDRTNGYYDIIVKNKITKTIDFKHENGECDSKDVVTTKTSALIFDGKMYK